MPRIAIARRHLRPQLLAGKHAARAAVHPVEVNTTMKSTMRVSARGKINSVVSDRSGPPHRGWLRFRSESRSLSFNGKAPLLTASRTSSRVLVGAEAASRDGAASTAARDMAGSPRRRAEQRHKFVVFLCRGAMRLASTFVAQQGLPTSWDCWQPKIRACGGFWSFPSGRDAVQPGVRIKALDVLFMR